MDKKGFYNQLQVVIVMAMVLGALIVLIFAGTMFFPVIADVGKDLNSAFQGAVQETNDTGLIVASEASFGSANKVLQSFQWISYTMIVLLFLTFIVMAFYTRTYPFLAFIWIAVVICLVFISLIFSISYRNMVTDAGDLSLAYESWKNHHFMMLYLPHIITVIGIFGGVVMFILATKDQEAEAVPI